MGPSFYTSYAGSAGDRGTVQRFHFDVQHELTRRGAPYTRVRAGLRRAEPAAGPPPDVLDCAALLALYSPEYLEEEQCALEWSVFAERMDRVERLTGRRPASLVGVLWEPEGLVLPQVVASGGRILADVSGQGYQGRGVRDLQGDPEARMLYRRTVSAVADELAQAAANPLPPMSEAAARDVRPRFGPSARRGEEPSPPPRTAPEEREGPVRRVVVALVTGTSAKMEHLRSSVAAYGNTPEEWSPFAPQSFESAVSVVSRTLRACGLDGVQFVSLDADRTLPRLRSDDDSAVVLVVDPWLTGDAAFPVLWERLARCEAGVSAVIVVLPRQDDESRLNTSRLRDSFARTPARLLGAAHHEVGTPQALAYTVAGVLADVSSEGGGGQGIPLGLPVESPAERRSRRRRERAEWLTPAARQQASLVGGATGELWGDG